MPFSLAPRLYTFVAGYVIPDEGIGCRVGIRRNCSMRDTRRYQAPKRGGPGYLLVFVEDERCEILVFPSKAERRKHIKHLIKTRNVSCYGAFTNLPGLTRCDAFIVVSEPAENKNEIIII